MAQVMIIAEAASAHDGDLDKALALISVAKRAGADAVKFQTYYADTLARQRNAPGYLSFYRKHEMPLAWLPFLKTACDMTKIEFMTTVYHADYLPLVAPFVWRWKISSFEAADRNFIAAHLPFRKPLIISTGMMAHDEVDDLNSWLHGWTHDPPDTWEGIGLTLLHCVSGYPTPMDQAALRAITALRWGFGGYDCGIGNGAKIGFSDHTANELTGALAVAAGAQVLEVHVCLEETNPDNPDRAYALLPDQFRRYVELARLAAQAMDDGRGKAPMECEKEMLKYRVTGGQV